MAGGGLKKVFASLTLFIGYTISQNIYRNDYVSIGSSFYKYHRDLTRYERAKQACEFEGATLFYPETETEMTSAWLEWAKSEVGSPSERNLLIGVQVINTTTKETLTVDNKTFNMPFDMGVSFGAEEILCMFLNYPDIKFISNGCEIHSSFFCKKPKASIQWNDKCNMATIPTNGNDYVYDSKLDKCYKLHVVPRRWPKAVEICKAEQSYLTELNSQEEADHLVEMVTKVPEEDVGVVCLGFQKTSEKIWKMLRGDKLLRESGYPMWAHTQPDLDESARFGAMAYNGRLHNIRKDARCIFVCERDIKKTP